MTAAENRWRSGRKKSDCHLKKIESCLGINKKLQNDSAASSLLTTSRGLDDLCINTHEMIKCLKSHLKICGTMIHRDLFNLYSEEFIKSFDQVCQAGELRTDFLKESPCIVDKVLLTKNYKTSCNQPFLMALNQMRETQSMDDRMDMTCCSYNKWRHCMHEKIIKECGQPAKLAMDDFVKFTSRDLANMVCPNDTFDPSSKVCQSLKAPRIDFDQMKGDNIITKYLLSQYGFLFHPT
ncbi:uncharacterized protein LOC141853089 [Brevipalpus obovatus]|uniref:uncharacterized protein LOC141853089 n=1 Tax=Brevipalpus obovatus TaxID=246614 RepID=UPI003D9FA6B0